MRDEMHGLLVAMPLGFSQSKRSPYDEVLIAGSRDCREPGRGQRREEREHDVLAKQKKWCGVRQQ